MRSCCGGASNDRSPCFTTRTSRLETGNENDDILANILFQILGLWLRNITFGNMLTTNNIFTVYALCAFNIHKNFKVRL